MESHVNATSTENSNIAASINRATNVKKRPREYRMHGDTKRRRLQVELHVGGIDRRTRNGKRAMEWRDYALERKGGKACPIDTRERINAATFYLWRAVCLMSYIVADQKKRGTLINRRSMTLPQVNEAYDTAMSQWQKINDELELGKEIDLARRLMREGKP